MDGTARVGATLLTLLSAAAVAQGPGYHVAARYEIGGTEAGYDYLRVDSGSRRLFVAHGTRIEVLDADTGARLGEVPNLAGAHGIEIVDRLHMAFATSGADRTVRMFDPRTLQVVTARRSTVLRDASSHRIGTAQTAPGARTIALDDKMGRLFLPAGRFGEAPAPTTAEPEPRAPLIPESFAIIVIAP